MSDDNVTRIHPAPSIPNPLFHDPWRTMTDDGIAEALRDLEARMGAIEHTKRALLRERARRNRAFDFVTDAEGRREYEPGAFTTTSEAEQ